LYSSLDVYFDENVLGCERQRAREPESQREIDREREREPKSQRARESQREESKMMEREADKGLYSWFHF
jgi:hypothetical protein